MQVVPIISDTNVVFTSLESLGLLELIYEEKHNFAYTTISNFLYFVIYNAQIQMQVVGDI